MIHAENDFFVHYASFVLVLRKINEQISNCCGPSGRDGQMIFICHEKEGVTDNWVLITLLLQNSLLRTSIVGLAGGLDGKLYPPHP